MPDMPDVLWKWWKKIAGVTLVVTLVVWMITLLLPDEYVSVATALPANSMTADKARIFNSNIEALYSDIGLSDELDKIIGTATLDTIYINTAIKFNLPHYYNISSPNEGIYQAALRLKKNSKVSKSAYGELKVEVWDKDKGLAAALANWLMQELQQLHQSLQQSSNTMVLKKIEEDYKKQQQQYTQTSDSLNQASGVAREIWAAQKGVQLEQLQQYQKLMAQYQLVLNTNPQVLLIVENARPSLKPDKPPRLAIVVATLVTSFLFTVLAALAIESRNKNAGSNIQQK